MAGARRRRWSRWIWLGLGAALAVLTAALTTLPGRAASGAAPPPGWPAIALPEVVDGLSRPVHLAHAGDGSGRLFVVEQAGRIRIVKDGALLPTPFLDITDRVQCCGEMGLLSVAFPPDYAAKGYFYVNYTAPTGDPDRPLTVIARFYRTADADRASPSSEQRLLTIPQPFANHNGGQLAFGPDDGYLYIGMGDGGSGNDPLRLAQNPGSLLGKLLRIDVEAAARPYVPLAPFANRGYLPRVAAETPARAAYRIPADNPFVAAPGYRPEIWAIGLRNPWRFSFDRTTGDLLIADVGQAAYEEIDFQPASSGGGLNYGWPQTEGLHCNPAVAPSCSFSGVTRPIAEYGRAEGQSVTGGFVYRGQQQPALAGIYFYADYASGRIWGLRRAGSAWESAALLDAPFNITSFGEDQAGELYLTNYLGGAIHRLTSP